MTTLEQYNWSNKLILVVDDDRASSMLLELIISKTGAKMIFVSNGRSAVDTFLSTHGVDLIIMDIKMEGLNGLEATRLIREHNPQVPIIAQTACVIAGDKEKCLEAGCNDYIPKPINIKELMDTLNKYLEQTNPIVKVNDLFSEN
jgi:CheY-like chemotaxis protein